MCRCSREAPTVALSIPGPLGWSAIRALRNGAVVHYRASITGVNWVGSHAKPFLPVWHKLQVKPSSISALFLSIYFLVFYGHLVVTCRVSTSEKPPYWKSMACNLGTFYSAACRDLFLLVGLKLNHHVLCLGWIIWRAEGGRTYSRCSFLLVIMQWKRDWEMMYSSPLFLASLISSCSERNTIICDIFLF